MAAKHDQSLPHLQSGEVTLLDYSADDPRDVVTLSDKEALVLQLYNQVQEQQLEKAFLEQGVSDKNFAMLIFFFFFPLSLLFCLSFFFLIAFILLELESISGSDPEEQLAIAERELLEARSTYTVRRKAIRTILMTEPILKAVHLKAATPAERYVP
jgi:hypothetical protein